MGYYYLSMWEKIKTWHNDHEYLVWIVLFVSVLRIPSLFEPYWYGDEGVYMTLGLAIRRGLTLYSQIHDNKPPLLYLASALAGNLMWLRVLLMAWNAASVFMIGRLAEKIGFKKWVAYLVAFIFGVFTTLPWIEGNIANGEIFMIMPAVAAVLLLISKVQGTRLKYLLVGLLFSIGFLFKVPIAFDLFGIGLWMVFFQDKKIFSSRGLVDGIWMIVGFGVPVLLTVGYYFLRGAGWEFIHAALLQNVTYLASWRTGYIATSGVGNQSGLVMRLGVAIVATILIWLLTLGEKAKIRLIFVWFVWALFGALLSERPYPHYLIEVVAPASLLIGVVAQMIVKMKPRLSLVAVIILVGLLAAGIVKYKFYFFPTLRYYSIFEKYVTKKISLMEYYASFDPKTKQTYEVASYLKMRTNPDESIFLWGDEPYIYALADRLPPGRFTVAYHVLDFGGQAETIASIKEKQTPYIVVFGGARQFKELNSILNVDYARVATIEQAEVYRRIVIPGVK